MNRTPNTGRAAADWERRFRESVARGDRPDALVADRRAPSPVAPRRRVWYRLARWVRRR